MPLCLAEHLALEAGLLSAGEPYTMLTSPRARALFTRHAIAGTGGLYRPSLP